MSTGKHPMQEFSAPFLLPTGSGKGIPFPRCAFAFHRGFSDAGNHERADDFGRQL